MLSAMSVRAFPMSQDASPSTRQAFPDSIIDSDVKRAEFVSEPKLATLP